MSAVSSVVTRTVRLHGWALVCMLLGLLLLQVVPVQALSAGWLFLLASLLAVSEQYRRLSEGFRVPQDGGLREGR